MSLSRLRRWLGGGRSPRDSTRSGGAPTRADRTSPTFDDLLKSVRRIPASESQFGVEIVDCRAVAGSLLSMTRDESVAQRFLQLRGDLRPGLRGVEPADPLSMACLLTYPHDGRRRDGLLFMAREMEDKWDIFVYDGILYFTRSWTGELAFTAEIVVAEPRARVTRVVAQSHAASGDPRLAVGIVDFLIKSHLHQVVAPHPLPAEIGENLEACALYSFSQFGRWGAFGTTSDVTGLQVCALPGGGYQLRAEV